ncbi:protein glass-like isoform X2 [Corythoichthys intestinalis]|uniref:protein glass-like isoform X2 n=1 Tax=Corythoichthys intestinalis TaxID=161448 RepID=UPI0025A55933|nr:protein glass-like isoform X2 [Corythoichthys intestinalis]
MPASLTGLLMIKYLPKSTSKRLVVGNPEEARVPDIVKAPPPSTPERVSVSVLTSPLTRPDQTPPKHTLILPALRNEPAVPPLPVIKSEKVDPQVTPLKREAQVSSLKDVRSGGREELERNGHFGETAAAAAGASVYECPRCSEVFSQASRLCLHLEQKRKTYACDWCCKSFAQSADLRRHVRTHTGERPHRCTFCTKSFSQRGNLRRHVRIHTGERPYRCGVCRRTFSDGDTLKKHARTHRKVEDGLADVGRFGA